MNKIKFQLEYPLNSTSLNVLWNAIGTPLGLAEWFSDELSVTDNKFTFFWNQHEQSAILLGSKTNSFIQFQWEEEAETEYYFELKIVVLELTGELALVITDFAEPGEEEALKLVWDKQVEVLRRKTGI